jgi:hypothetical protein
MAGQTISLTGAKGEVKNGGWNILDRDARENLDAIHLHFEKRYPPMFGFRNAITYLLTSNCNKATLRVVRNPYFAQETTPC